MWGRVVRADNQRNRIRPTHQLLDGPSQADSAAAAAENAENAENTEGDTNAAPPCKFKGAGEFELAVADAESYKTMHEKLCSDCSWKVFREKGADAQDCDGAKKQFRLLAKSYHPDVVDKKFPDCKDVLDLRRLATEIMMDATKLINRYCSKKLA